MLCGIHRGEELFNGEYCGVFSPYSNIVDELGVTCVTSTIPNSYK